MKHTKTLESLVQGLTILSFVLLCWVLHRGLQERTHCLESSFVTLVQADGDRVFNCRYESRLSLNGLFARLTPLQMKASRAMRAAEPLRSLFNARAPELAVEVLSDDRHFFELGKGYVRLGEAWLDDPTQLKRALIMGLLKSARESSYANQFQLEVMTDFVLQAVFGEDTWYSQGSAYSFTRHVVFPTSSPTFEKYCRSPFKSLAHSGLCQMPEPDSGDLQTKVWGFRPLLASALVRVYNKLSLAEKLHVLAQLRAGPSLPVVKSVRADGVVAMMMWFQSTLDEHLTALGMNGSEDARLAVKRALQELQVEAPTKWELTVDLTKTPAWREIIEQLRQRSRFHDRERVLVFTPDGGLALPSGLPVTWDVADIHSHKHVLIACNWPRPDEAVPVQARHMYAEQSCGKLTRAFWEN